MECVRALLGNPALKNHMKYAPERVYEDNEGMNRILDEMWTVDWWWNTQVYFSFLKMLSKLTDCQKKLPVDSTIAPLILSSDKTQLTQFHGDKSAWPVYLTLGNIAKAKHHQVGAHATILIGYLPVAKLDNFMNETHSVQGYRLFHYCMCQLLGLIVNAGKKRG